MNLTSTALLDLSHTLAGDYLARFQYPWEAPDSVKTLILTLGPRRSMGSIPPASGSTKPPPPPPRRSWARPASSARAPGSGTAPLSGTPSWWAGAAW